MPIRPLNIALAVGDQTVAPGDFAVAVGPGAMAVESGTSSYGAHAKASGGLASAFGHQSLATLGSSTAIGSFANARAVRGTVVGAVSYVSGNRGSGFGQGVTVGHDDSMAFGVGAATTADNQVVFGSETSSFDELWLGRGATHTGSSQTTEIRATDGSGTNIDGDTLRLVAGRSTGNGAGGNLEFYTANAGSSGSSLNSAYSRLQINQVGSFRFGTTDEPTPTMAGPRGFSHSESSAETWLFRGSNGSGTNSPGDNLEFNGGRSTGDAAGGDILFQTSSAGASGTSQNSLTERLRIYEGLQVGSPTGGDKGAGTINVATDIYKNNTAYTNPDYVFEHEFTGRIEQFKDNPGARSYRGRMGLDELREHVRAHWQLPGALGVSGMFERADWLLEKVEELYLHLLDLDTRVKELAGNAVFPVK